MTVNRVLALVGVLLAFAAVGVSLLPLPAGLSDVAAHSSEAEARTTNAANGRFTSPLTFREVAVAPVIDRNTETPAGDVPDQELRLAGVGMDLTGPVCWVGVGEGEAVALRVGDRLQRQEIVRIGNAEVELQSVEGVTTLSLFAGH